MDTDVSSEVTGEMVEAAAPVESEIQEPQAEAPAAQMDSVPVSALQAERKERQRLQEEMQLLRNHVELMQQSNQKPQQADPMDQMSDDDVLTVGEAKKFISQMNQKYSSNIEELKMTQKHPDYQEVVSQYLPELLKEQPYLRSTLQNDPNRYQLAYDLAKKSTAYQSRAKQSKRSKEAEKIIHNSQQTGSLSSIGHSTATQAPSGYKNMSDSDFKRLVERNMGFA